MEYLLEYDIFLNSPNLHQHVLRKIDNRDEAYSQFNLMRKLVAYDNIKLYEIRLMDEITKWVN